MTTLRPSVGSRSDGADDAWRLGAGDRLAAGLLAAPLTITGGAAASRRDRGDLRRWAVGAAVEDAAVQPESARCKQAEDEERSQAPG